MLLFLFLSTMSYAGQYDQAIKTTLTAVAKQTGLEADFLKVRSASNKAIVKWARDNGVETPLTVVSFIAPVVYRRQIRIRTGDFTFKANDSKVDLNWQIQF
jgi:hypothetical protein